MQRLLILFVIVSAIFACNNQSKPSDTQADMYEASELSLTMRSMVEYSKTIREQIRNNEDIDPVPDSIWNLKSAEGTRNEHMEDAFQALADPYLDALKGLERGDSNAYYYTRAINACKSCHSSYCGGPMAVINQLGL